ncbi:sensor histidine kinase [Aureibacter tunicatorum]|uniref:histidine kinase n=1 Tax=Aureibacter tunicatorum TaxID=866807 RepID=A0AAE3XKA1_9BACT|nr:HAMP domain-containing sensor histidine kinase [Aureibacter tunicatorum]MDR6237480.1 two-component system phosphate regulon sensor histidine kinase PhoR [Aureibacter tunicatorum]BDD06469.1 two-component sensor histidine kinase [Aureibacter tunicatorum]
MSKNKLYFIIILMSFSLLGLISIQFNWITQLIDENNTSFRKDVLSALNNVSKRLEQREVLYIAKNSFFSDGENQNASVFEQDTLLFFNQFLPQTPTILSLDSFQSKDNNQISVRLNEKKDIFNFNYKIRNEKNEYPEFNQNIRIQFKQHKNFVDSVFKYDFNERRVIPKVNERKQMVTIVLNELYSKERKVDNRIDSIYLDSLLREEMRFKGIKVPYQYGVIFNKSKELFISNTADEEALQNSEYKARLFKNDIYGSPSTLAVIFPEKDRYILQTISFNLFLSLILILIILYSYWYSIHTILRQKKLSEIKTDFINNMTHELKTPISTISLAYEALTDKDMRNNANILERYLNIIDNENKRMLKQVENVLKIASLDKKDFELAKEPKDINAIIDKSIKHFEMLIEKKGGKISKNLSASPATIKIDETHMRNVFDNLLDNANKYSLDSPPIIEVTSKNVSNGILISVKDHGIGMKKEDQKQVFEKFYRVPTGNVHNVKGFGLGLSYVKSIVEKHDGTVKLNSQLNKGTTFEIFLPYE